MEPADFRRHGYALVDWIADYLAGAERYPVLSRNSPGELVDALPSSAPEQGEPFEVIFQDFERLIVPALTHWNHPGFFGYFAISASASGVLAELLSAALNQQGMLWRTSPAATELEEVALGWLRTLLGLPPAFDGVIYDTASISTLHALAAAREVAVPGVREQGLPTSGRVLRLYCSEHAHSSVDKAAILLGLGQRSVCHVPADEQFRMRVDALRDAVLRDIAEGAVPIAIVATIGTTATTSVDPVREISALCHEHRIWLHVDAAYAGVTAMLHDRREHFDGWESADSIVINPHKWLFVPFDLSAMYCRRMDLVHRTFSLVPDFLRTGDGARARNLMDTGIQLGRRFRALKLWMVLRHLGAERIRATLTEHMRLARLFAQWVDDDPDFERLAPVPFSVVCFRVRPQALSHDDLALDSFNERLLGAVNASGDVFLSHTRLNGRIALRLAIGHLRTTEAHVARAWTLLRAHMAALGAMS